MLAPRRTLLWIAALAISLGACATAPPAPGRPAPAPVAAPPPAPPVATPAPREPPLSLEEARDQARAWKAAWLRRPRRAEEQAAIASFDASNGIDERRVRRVLEAMLRDCLAERSPDAKACEHLGPTATADPLVSLAIEMAGEVGDTRPGVGETLQLLVRVEARGGWRAGMAIERLLERRMLGAPTSCSPPTTQEVEAARASLGDERVRDANGALRSLTESELADRAYLHAALKHAGPEIGAAREDEASPALPEGSPEHARRAAQRDAMQEALLDGDVVRHAAAAEAYLAMLGHPGPIRVAEETDRRWGGKGFSYAMRLWGRSAALLGRYDVAEPLHRRAAPGGGMCGTSTPSVLRDQTEGAIRAAELREGCRPIVAERLFAPGSSIYGPRRLRNAGFDVARLYRAALLEVEGAPDWAQRLRAVPGFADEVGREAVPRLLELAERGAPPRRIAALGALGELLRSVGVDPCLASPFGGMYASGVGVRDVASIMDDCETKLDDATLAKTIRRASALATHTDPGVREALAQMLGAAASPHGRVALQTLARDTHDAGGTVCTSTDGGAQRCEPNLPVRLAARLGLEALKRDEAMRRTQAEHVRKSKVR